MAAGENTLNAVCTRLTMRSITENKKYKSGAFLKDYVKFMTTPGTHNDTYAESFHRDFFSNWAAGIAPERCAGQASRPPDPADVAPSTPLMTF